MVRIHFLLRSSFPQVVTLGFGAVMQVADGRLVVGFPPFGLPLFGFQLVLIVFFGGKVKPVVPEGCILRGGVLCCHPWPHLEELSAVSITKKPDCPCRFGNPAVPSHGPVAFRPHLTMGLALFKVFGNIRYRYCKRCACLMTKDILILNQYIMGLSFVRPRWM